MSSEASRADRLDAAWPSPDVSLRRGGPLTWADALKPGRAIEARHWHDPDCLMPKGGPCSCVDGPDIELRDLAPPDRN